MKERRESIILTSGGLKTFGILHIPEGVPRPPCVFFCHGLAGNKIGKDRLYVEIATRLSEAGIASFRMDFRGAGDSEGLFSDILPEYYIEDTLVALKFLRERADLDANRLGIMARSFGGPVAVEAAAKFLKIKSLALWCPMFSGSQWIDRWQLVLTKAVDQNQITEMMRINGQQGSSQFFERFLQVNVEDSLIKIASIPLLHIHGEVDTKVSIQHAHDYERIRKGVLAESKFIRLPNTDHDFSHFEEKQHSIDETVSWFRKTL